MIILRSCPTPKEYVYCPPHQGKMNRSTLKINEIFYSLQGESTHAGKPCVFVRLTYCNLRCTYCDTTYAFFEGMDMTVPAIMEAVAAYRCRTVEITGGEPLLQDGVLVLMSRLADDGYEVLLETGGSLDISGVDQRVVTIMDIKCPSSGMVEKNRLENLALLRQHDEIKFVVGDRDDYDWMKAFIGEHGLGEKNTILVSPVFDRLEPRELAEWILTDRLPSQVPNLRFQLQMHKFIWSPETRGV